eukprot:scaffold333192_cov21-Prasinocladus_malaysianus.AAC.1
MDGKVMPFLWVLYRHVGVRFVIVVAKGQRMVGREKGVGDDLHIAGDDREECAVVLLGGPKIHRAQA